MKRIKIVLVVIAALFCGAAFAQATGTATGTGTAQAVGGQATQVFAPVSGDVTTRYDVSGAYGPALTTSNDTCMGSTSGGVSSSWISVSLGTTWTDLDCKTGKKARDAWNMGEHYAAITILCTDSVFRYAIAASGGVVVTDDKGQSYHVSCPMSQKDWEAAGEPLLDPATGKAMANYQMIARIDRSAPSVPPVAAAARTPMSQEAMIARIKAMPDSERRTLIEAASIVSSNIYLNAKKVSESTQAPLPTASDIETHAALLREQEAASVASK
jgi:hypothetical protein